MCGLTGQGNPSAGKTTKGSGDRQMVIFLLNAFGAKPP
jgi:hypothetical protein